LDAEALHDLSQLVFRPSRDQLGRGNIWSGAPLQEDHKRDWRSAGVELDLPPDFPSTHSGKSMAVCLILTVHTQDGAGSNLADRLVAELSFKFPARDHYKVYLKARTDGGALGKIKGGLHRPEADQTTAERKIWNQAFGEPVPFVGAWHLGVMSSGPLGGAPFDRRQSLGFHVVELSRCDDHASELAQGLLAAVDGFVLRLRSLVHDPASRFAHELRMFWGDVPANAITRRQQPNAGGILSPTESLRYHLESRKCVILQGPPGTGKTYAALELVKHLARTDSTENFQWSRLVEDTQSIEHEVDFARAIEASKGLPVVWEIVQMHPGYAYEDFVCGMATAGGSGIHFVPKDRIVLELAKVAEANPERPVLLIMDEINRCSLSSVLGELILALEPDKRDLPIRLQYGGAEKLPSNLWFLGTMNTADRSIALVDYAIRRRFRFIDIEPSPAALVSYYAKRGGPMPCSLAEKAMTEINFAIHRPNLRVGPAYFMEDATRNAPRWAQRMTDRLVYEVLPLLREYLGEDKGVLGAGTTVKIGEIEIDIAKRQGGNFDGYRASLEAFFEGT
jgi:DNA polymerase III delta prime subunit